MIDFTGLNPMEATKEFAEATVELAQLLASMGISGDAIPGWITGAAVTALLHYLRGEDV